MRTILKKQGMKFKLGTKVTSVDKQGDGKLKISVEAAAGGKEEVIDADVCLVSVGRRQYLDNLGTEAVGVEMDPESGGRLVKVDDEFRTSVPSIFAIGDIIKGPMLAHKAEDEGCMVAEYVAGDAGDAEDARAPYFSRN